MNKALYTFFFSPIRLVRYTAGLRGHLAWGRKHHEDSSLHEHAVCVKYDFGEWFVGPYVVSIPQLFSIGIHIFFIRVWYRWEKPYGA